MQRRPEQMQVYAHTVPSQWSSSVDSVLIWSGIDLLAFHGISGSLRMVLVHRGSEHLPLNFHPQVCRTVRVKVIPCDTPEPKKHENSDKRNHFGQVPHGPGL